MKIAYCPICAEPSGRPETNSTFPFCAARCRTLDLARWLDGKYTLSDEPQVDGMQMDRIEN